MQMKFFIYVTKNIGGLTYSRVDGSKTQASADRVLTEPVLRFSRACWMWSRVVCVVALAYSASGFYFCFFNDELRSHGVLAGSPVVLSANRIVDAFDVVVVSRLTFHFVRHSQTLARLLASTIFLFKDVDTRRVKKLHQKVLYIVSFSGFYLTLIADCCYRIQELLNAYTSQ